MAIFSPTSTTPMSEPQLKLADRFGFLGEPSYIVEGFDGADDALAALDAVQAGSVSTGFQSLNWLTVLYEELAPAYGVEPRVVVVTDRLTGDVALALPLLIEQGTRLRRARFADLGASHIGAPILGPAAVSDAHSIRRIWRLALSCLRDVDLVQFERMPQSIGNVANPLLFLRGVVPSREPANILDLDQISFSPERPSRFYRAETCDQIARVFNALEEQQETADDAAITALIDRDFYERLAMDGTDAGLCYLFAIESGDEIIETLFGIVHDGVFTVLKAGTTLGPQDDAAAGLAVFVEAMRYLAERRVRRIDFGAGNAALKSAFSAQPVALFDLVQARSLAAAPLAWWLRSKTRRGQGASGTSAV